jgi:hypothetical protein
MGVGAVYVCVIVDMSGVYEGILRVFRVVILLLGPLTPMQLPDAGEYDRCLRPWARAGKDGGNGKIVRGKCLPREGAGA